MAPNYSTDESLGEALREYFAAEAPSLRAPTDLWDTLEGRLEEPRRMPRIRRKILDAASRYWLPTLATGGAVAAGAVLAVWASIGQFRRRRSARSSRGGLRAGSHYGSPADPRPDTGPDGDSRLKSGRSKSEKIVDRRGRSRRFRSRRW